MIRVLGVAGLLGSAVAVLAAEFGLTIPFALDGRDLNALLLFAIGGIALGFIAGMACLRGRSRLVCFATLTLATMLCAAAMVWPESRDPIAERGILSAGDRFWVLFDLILYAVVGLVLMNVGILGGRRGRDDE